MGAVPAGLGDDLLGASAAADPITLTDPDGAVTRVASWSTWAREQSRAPGGEPALVTRLEAGQLWFAAGRTQTPWRHEVHVGPAVVSTPRGRFHVTADADGGATIACLTGRTRVVTSLKEPVLLVADQTAAVSADGTTIVVMDRTPVLEATDPSAVGRPSDRPARGAPPRSRGPEVAVLVALVVVLLGAAALFARDRWAGTDEATVPITAPANPAVEKPSATEPRVVTSTTAARTSTTVPITSQTAPGLTTTAPPPVTTAPPPTPVTNPPSVAADPGVVTGRLVECRRTDGGVIAVVQLVHRSGGPGIADVEVGVVARSGRVVASGQVRSDPVEPGGSAAVEVPVQFSSSSASACELLGVNGL